MFFVNRDGIKTIRWIVYISFPLSVVFIYFIMFFGITLEPGVATSVKEFLFGDPNDVKTLWERLQESTMWKDASQ